MAADAKDFDELLRRLDGDRIQEADLRLSRRGRALRVVRARVRSAADESRRELRWSLQERTEDFAAENARLAAIIDQIPVGVLMLDAATRSVVAANSAAKLILGGGFPPSDRVGYRKDGTSYGPDEWPIMRSLRTGETIQGERIAVVKDESSMTLEISSAPVLDANGKRIAAVSVFQDVTARERREVAEREFVANAAHELRTPLAAITGAIELLQSGAKYDEDARERFLGHIERESQRLQRLVRALLTLARAQTQTEAPKLEIVPLCGLLAETVETLEPRPRVPLEIDCAEEVAALANPDLLERVVANLVANASQYTTAGGIVVAAEAVDDGLVELTVADTGPGVAPEQRERMFERFFRGARDRDGFGLGLSIVSEAVRAMDGTIAVEAAEGGGTVVRVRLRGATVLER
jgi:two-component system phosphate regulon sensor histidine kinase PhoR